MKVHDGIDRDASADEIKAIDEVQADRSADQAALEAKAINKTSAHNKLAVLGLTDAEIAALVA